MSRLKGKVAVVTGGNSGIGLASAKRLLDEGARVAISGRSQKTLADAVQSLGNGVLAVQSDVSKLSDIDKLYSAVAAKFGKIDILFANAGVAKFFPFADTTERLMAYTHSRWADEAAFQKHGVLPHTERFLKRVDALLDQPREVTSRTEMIA